LTDYQEFLAKKRIVDVPTGFTAGDLNPNAFGEEPITERKKHNGKKEIRRTKTQ
jgi:hypothetical protein